MDYQERIINHYVKIWNAEPKFHFWSLGPAEELPYDFRVLEFAPTQMRTMWTYATCCMSQSNDANKIELHIFSSKQNTGLIELLTVVAHYHRTGSKLDLNHTVNFGRAWQDDSNCEFGFISLPYLDGPAVENMSTMENSSLKCYWLIPITKAEVEYKKKQGVEALELLFEEKEIDYLNVQRSSLI